MAAVLDRAVDSYMVPMRDREISSKTAKNTLNVDPQVDFHQVILNCLLCESNSIILLSDANIHVDAVTNYLTKHSIVFTHWDQRHMSYVEDEIERNLTKIYEHYPRTTFVVLLHQPTHLMGIIDAIAQNRGRGQLSLMRHKTQWLVVIWRDEQMEQLINQQKFSVLDNVAVIHIANKHDMKSLPILKMVTFMWRTNQTREAQRFDLDFSEKKCVIFPNKKFGMNGRMVKVVVKPFFETLLSIKMNPETNALDYKGKGIELLSIMAEKLNFSYEIWPSAGRRVFKRWEEYGRMISNGTFDVGLNVWSFLYGKLGPYSVTYPINFDVITGLYRSPEESEREMSIFLLFPFPRIIYLCIGMMVIGTAILYMTTRRSHLSDNACKQQGQDKSKQKIPMQSFLAIIGKLSASVINQNYLPNPANMSSRILLGCWSLTLVILYALDTGYITASMVKQNVHLPFETFEQLVSRDDYKTGTIENSIVSIVINKSRPGVLGSLGDRVRRISVDETLTAGEIVESSMSSNSNDGKFVLIYYEMALREWLKKQDNPKQYTIMDRYLIDSSAGMLLHKNSDLTLLLSHNIMRMHETGLLSEDHRRSGSRQKNKNDEDSDNIAKKALNLIDFFWPFICVVLLLALAFLTLMIEVVIVKLRLKRMYEVTF